MINYLITSMILSAIGWLAYVLIVRRKAVPIHQKWFIYFVVISSLIIPIFAPQPAAKADEPALMPKMAFGQQLHLEEIQLQHLCKCENPNFSHRVIYRSNTFYNLVLEHKQVITWVILVALLLVFVRILFQYRYLHRLVARSRKADRWQGKQRYTLLFPEKAHAVGAFYLRQPYIIWQAEMGHLSEAELAAVISHELSHIRQLNTLEKSVLSLIQCFWLLNPVFYYFRKELDLISEWIADRNGSTTIGNAKAYAQLLVRMKELQSLPLVSPFKGKRQHTLKGRIQRILTHPKGHWAYPMIALTAVFCLQIALVGALSARVDQTLEEFKTYEEIYLEHPEEEECLYCTDCHTVCVPGE